eukprot:2579987-Pyramimonas_sp.AAC.1
MRALGLCQLRDQGYAAEVMRGFEAMQVAYRRGGCFWSSGAGLRGLMTFVLEERHLGALDSIETILLGRLAGGRMSWTQVGGTTRCYSNKGVLQKSRIPRCSTALRIRRLRWHPQRAKHLEDVGRAFAVLFGTSKLGRLCR